MVWRCRWERRKGASVKARKVGEGEVEFGEGDEEGVDERR